MTWQAGETPIEERLKIRRKEEASRHTDESSQLASELKASLAFRFPSRCGRGWEAVETKRVTYPDLKRCAFFTKDLPKQATWTEGDPTRATCFYIHALLNDEMMGSTGRFGMLKQ